MHLTYDFLIFLPASFLSSFAPCSYVAIANSYILGNFLFSQRRLHIHLKFSFSGFHFQLKVSSYFQCVSLIQIKTFLAPQFSHFSKVFRTDFSARQVLSHIYDRKRGRKIFGNYFLCILA
jgi:hypothetical protein